MATAEYRTATGNDSIIHAHMGACIKTGAKKHVEIVVTVAKTPCSWCTGLAKAFRTHTLHHSANTPRNNQSGWVAMPWARAWCEGRPAGQLAPHDAMSTAMMNKAMVAVPVLLVIIMKSGTTSTRKLHPPTSITLRRLPTRSDSSLHLMRGWSKTSTAVLEPTLLFVYAWRGFVGCCVHARQPHTPANSAQTLAGVLL